MGKKGGKTTTRTLKSQSPVAIKLNWSTHGGRVPGLQPQPHKLALSH